MRPLNSFYYVYLAEIALTVYIGTYLYYIYTFFWLAHSPILLFSPYTGFKQYPTATRPFSGNIWGRYIYICTMREYLMKIPINAHVCTAHGFIDWQPVGKSPVAVFTNYCVKYPKTRETTKSNDDNNSVYGVPYVHMYNVLFDVFTVIKLEIALMQWTRFFF